MDKSYNQHDVNSYHQAYSPINMKMGLSMNEIDIFRKRLLQNLSELNINKHLLRTGDYNQLINYHNYSLNILNNMQNIKHVEINNPFNINMENVMGHRAQSGIETINPYEKNLKIICSNDGKTQIVDSDPYKNQIKQEWEAQFDDNIINPPTYIMPPNNYWNANPNQNHF